jgi:hypothetical protein
MKKLYLVQNNLIYDARAKLPAVLPNIETLYIESQREVYICYKIMCCSLEIYTCYISHNIWCIVYLIHEVLCVQVVDAPMLPTKFLYLKHLTIIWRLGYVSWAYDYFSLVSFLDASPSLETFILDVRR